MTEEQVEWYKEHTADWTVYGDQERVGEWTGRFEVLYELSGTYQLPMRWILPCILVNLAFFGIGYRRAALFQKAFLEGAKGELVEFYAMSFRGLVFWYIVALALLYYTAIADWFIQVEVFGGVVWLMFEMHFVQVVKAWGK